MSDLEKTEAPIKTIDAMKVFTAEEKSRKTMDGFDNFVSRLGLNNDNALSAGTYEFNLVTRVRIKLEAAYRGSWVVGAIIDSVAEDMTRSGIEVTTGESEVDVKDLYSAITKLKLWQSECSRIKWGRLYGAAIGVIQIEGQDLETPLDYSTIAKDQFKGIVVYDRWQLNPQLYDVIQSGPDIGLPQYYNIVNNPTQLDPQSPTATGQTKVHHSRCLRYLGIELPYFQAITEMMWGESILERLWDRLIAFDNATMSAANLIDRANLRTVGIEGLREIIAAGGAAQAGLHAQFDMMRSLQVNEGLTLLDKNDTFQTTAYSFAGLSDMLLQFGQQLAGASDIPLVRLFGQSPSGLSSTGDADIRMYYDKIKAQQEAKLRPGWDKIIRVLWRSVYGQDAPEDMEFTFIPLWQLSATEKVANAKTNADAILSVFESGIISRVAALKELRGISKETGLFTNITDEDIDDAENEPPPMPETENPTDTKTPIIPETGLQELPRGKTILGDSKIGLKSAYQKIKAWLAK